jgi:DNA-binding MarR family transcriptional regulator
MEEEGWVRRVADSADRRVVRVEATEAGRSLLHTGRRRRVAALAADVARLGAAERRLLLEALPLLENLAVR